MRKNLIYIILIFFFGLLQSSFFFDVIRVAGVKPDLLLILIAFVAYKRGSVDGQLVGFGSGMLQTVFSSALFGMYAFIFTVVGFVMGFVQKKIYSDSFITAIILVFLATLVKGAVWGILAIFFGEVSQGFVVYLKNGLLLELILNPVLAGPIFWFLNRFAVPVMR